MTNNNQNDKPGMSQKQKELIKKYAVFCYHGNYFCGEHVPDFIAFGGQEGKTGTNGWL